MRISEMVEAGRVVVGEFRSPRGARYGAFRVWGPCGEWLSVLADDGMAVEGAELPREMLGWEHVSVSCRRVPNWEEMCFVKDLFWGEEETVVQFHPPRSEWVSNHARCLHLWRPVEGEIRRPPWQLVGAKGMGEVRNEADVRRAERVVEDGLRAMRAGEGG